MILRCGGRHGWCCFRYKPNMQFFGGVSDASWPKISSQIWPDDRGCAGEHRAVLQHLWSMLDLFRGSGAIAKCCGRSNQSSFVVNTRHYLAFVRPNSPLITSSKIRSPRTDVLVSTWASRAFLSYLVKDSLLDSCVHSRNPAVSVT